MKGMVIEDTAIGVIATAAEPGSEEEQKLKAEIRELWAAHEDAKATARRTKSEIKAARERLSERLVQHEATAGEAGKERRLVIFLKGRRISPRRPPTGSSATIRVLLARSRMSSLRRFRTPLKLTPRRDSARFFGS